MSLAFSLAPLFVALCQGQAAPDTRLAIEVDWTRAAALGLSGFADPVAERAALRDVVAWRLAVAGVRGELAAVKDRLELVLSAAPGKAEREELAHFVANLGTCEFFIVAEDSEEGVELERARFEEWRAQNPQGCLAVYNADPGRPERRLAWFTTHYGDKAGPPRPAWLASTLAGGFGASDFARTFSTQDRLGYPAIGFELRAERTEAFRVFTAANVNRFLAIVLAGEMRSSPVLNSQLVGSGIIEGRFSDKDMGELAGVLLGGPGPLRLLGPDEKR